MRYCPECKAEYRDGFDTCADCQILLVDELVPQLADGAPPIEGTIERIKMKNLIVASDLANISFLKVVLKDNNIDFFAMPRSALHSSGVLFKVDETKYYEALRLVDEIQQSLVVNDDNMEIEE